MLIGIAHLDSIPIELDLTSQTWSSGPGQNSMVLPVNMLSGVGVACFAIVAYGYDG